MTGGLNRRVFLAGSAMAGAGVLLGGTAQGASAEPPPPTPPRSPNEKLNIGVVGVAHQGAYNLGNVRGENVVALCDVDETLLAAAAKDIPGARTYHDFREMLERERLDAVVIATPDHTHAPATLLALEAGCHVYCEKPLTHTVAGARKVAEAARKHRRVTQMGTQIHAGANYRRVVELIRGGAIGPVRAAHCWVERAWTGGGDRPADTPPVPPTLHWDLWLGPAPERPYHPAYVPANWRGWWDFGGGTLGDMGCHHLDLPYWALDLRYPDTVEAEGPPVHPETTPAWMVVRYAYPARGGQPPVVLTWHHGGRRPPQFAAGLLPAWGDGTLFVGEKGMLLADYNRHVLLPEKDFAGFVPPAPTIPDSVGHHAEWIAACKTGGPTTCHFDYAGPLTEAVLLGNVAYRAGTKIEWDGRRGRVKNSRAADALLKAPRRKGWK